MGRIVAAVGRFVRPLARTLLIDLPLVLVGPLVASLLAAVLLWLMAAPREPAARILAGVLLFGCYSLAGLSWGLRKAVANVLWRSAEAFDRQAPALVDSVLERVLPAGSVDATQVEIAAVRRQWEQSVRIPFGQTDTEPGRLQLAGLVLRWMTRRILRLPAAVLEQFLQSLERQGETAVSARSLRVWLRDRMMAMAMQEVRRKSAMTSVCGHLVTLACPCIPLLAAWMYGGGVM